VEPHRRRADQYVLEPRRFEGSENTHELVSIHGPRVSRIAAIDQRLTKGSADEAASTTCGS